MSALSQRLRKFADRLGPHEDRQRECNQVINHLQRLLQNKLSRQFRIDRFRPAGSYAKKTALDCKFDLDLVCYFNFPLNVDEAGFEQFRAQIASDIEDAVTIGFRESEIESNDFGVQVKVNDLNLEIDIVVAMNTVPPNHMQGIPADDEQFRCAMEMIRRSSNPMRAAFMLSSSLSEKVLEFVRTKSAFVHSVARLAKFWNAMCIPADVTFSGQSSTMEIMAVKAAQEEETRGSQDVANAFRRFLTYWLHLDRLNITFNEYYRSDQIPAENRRAPVVLDPVNPYNNRLFRIKPDQRSRITQIARTTLSNLDKTEQIIRGMPSNRGARDSDKWMISMCIFPPCCPQSLKFVQLSVEASHGSLPIAAWCTDFEFNSRLASPKIEKRRVTPVNKKTMEDLFKRMWSMLRAESEVSQDMNEVSEVPFHTADGMISFLENKTKLPRGIVNDGRNDCLDYDATFKFPVGNGITFIMHVKW